MSLSDIWRRAQGGFGANAILTAATNLALGGLGVATGATVARLLGPHGRGELAAIQMWPTLLGYLGLLGTGDALVYYCAREPEGSASYLATGVSIALLASIPLGAIGYFVLPFVLAAQPSMVVRAARWYLMYLPVQAIAGLPFYPLRGRNDFLTWNALRLTPMVPWVLVLTTAWIVGWRSPSLIAYAY